MPRTPLILIALGVCALVPTAVRSETVVAESIDWAIADSDWVGVGVVIKVEKAGKFEVVTVRPTRIFKGNAAERLTFALPSYNGPVAKDWQKAGQPMLFCLVSNERGRKKDPGLPADVPWVLRDDGNSFDAFPLAKGLRRLSGTSAVYTRDFKILTEPTALLKRVERIAALHPTGQVPKQHTLDVPWGTELFQKLYAGSSVLLTVPVDADLEVQGRRWCASKEYYNRLTGVRILKHFKNDHNIQLLKSLLRDPGYSTGDGKKRYDVRRFAFETLGEFGVRVARPVLEESDKGKDR